VSECGPIRQGNEDAFSIDLESQLFVVADGMGGHAAGEVASRLAIEAIAAFMERSNGDQDLTWPFPLDPSISIEANRLGAALQVANRRVLRAAASHEDYHGMGTTVVAALFTASSVVVAHAGDSRLYEQRDGRLTRLTDDDSLMATLEQSADASARSAAQHAPRNVVTNVVGGGEAIDVHLAEYAREAGTCLLLCTDGIHGVLDDARIGGILASRDGPRQLAERLVAEALAAGGRDNATAVVVADRRTV
jgi:protein phosphatase